MLDEKQLEQLKKRQPYLAERFGWPEPISEEVSTEVRKHLWDERDRADPFYFERRGTRRGLVSQYLVSHSSGVEGISGCNFYRFWPAVPS